ncbi:MAG: peptidoglycan DD-metalloendopeptidase family protein [Bacilli bacterium]|nr:peptidoglycan DD-metalloendopeptidase family protein [Bacilli bacterium]
MKSILEKLIHISLICCLLFINFYVPEVNAASKTLGDLKNELQKFEKDYQDNKLQQEMSEQEIKNIQNKINTINSNIVKIGEEIKQLNEQIEQLTIEIQNKEAEIDNILSFTQVSNGESAYLEYAFGAQDFTDFIYRIAVSEQLTSYNNNLVDEYKADIELSKKTQEELRVKRTNLKTQQDNLKIELDKIKVTLTELDELSLSIEEEIEAKKAEIKLYESLGCKIDETLDQCRSKKIPTDTGFSRPMKSGYITGFFGMRYHPVSGTYKLHAGTDMSTMQAGDIPIYSVANGVVKKIVELKYNPSTGRYNSQCGGRRVYIEHNIKGKVYTTGYLHLRRIDVKEGQIVTRETQIGIMGGDPKKEYWDKACSTASHLHLEISTGTFAEGTYSAYQVGAEMYVNFPKKTYVTWYDRTTKY